MSLYVKYQPLGISGGGGGGTALTMGTFDGQAPAAAGATITLNQLFMQSADATHPGLMNTGAQTIAGDKTLTGLLSANALATGTTTVRSLASFFSDKVSVKDFGALGNNSADDTAAIQAALDFAANNNCGVYFPRGTYLISTTLTMGTSTFLEGEATASTVIKMSAQPTGAKPTYVGSTAYPPTLDYFPMLWNASPIQWFSISNIWLHGGDFDVYGLRLQENFYGEISHVTVSNCNKYSYINVRGQQVSNTNCAFYKNKASVLTFDNTTFVFDTCGFERTGAARATQVRSPVSTKCTVSFRDCWWEDDTGAANTTEAFLVLSGRNPVVNNCFFTHVGSAIHAIKAVGTADALTFDNISSPNVIGAIQGNFSINCASSLLINFDADCYGNILNGQFGTVTDTNTNNLYWNTAATAESWKLAGTLTLDAAITMSGTRPLTVGGEITAGDFASGSANSASTGALRLSALNSIRWRNNNNDGNLALAIDGTDGLSWNGHTFVTSAGLIPSTVFPALTGDVTTSAGSVVTSLVATTNGTLATLSALTSASSLATVGTISTGTWSADAIGATHGGTAQTSWATGDTLYSSATNTLAKLSGNTTTTKKYLAQTGTGAASQAPTWSTIDLSSADVTGILAAGRFPALTGDVTTSTGSLATALVATTNGTLTTLSALTTAASLATVGTITSGTWSGTAIGATKGGTAQTTWAKGDLLYSSATDTLAKLAGNITTSIKVLTQTGDGAASAAPAWNAATGTGNVVFSASPTLTGTLTAAAATFSSTITLPTVGTVDASGNFANIATLAIGTGAPISHTNENFTVLGTYATDASNTALDVDLRNTLDGNTTNSQENLISFRRTLASTSRTDSGSKYTPLRLQQRFTVNGTAVLTAAAAKYATLFVDAPTLTTDNAGTLALGDFAGIKVVTSTVNTGTTKYGIFVDTQSGASTNYGIFANGNNKFPGSVGIGANAANGRVLELDSGAAGTPAIKLTSSNGVAANGSVVTVLGSLGPAGSQTTVQGWLQIDVGGTTRYIPFF